MPLATGSNNLIEKLLSFRLLVCFSRISHAIVVHFATTAGGQI